MPKPELAELISQLSNQYTSLLSEVRSLKLSWWQKNYGSVIAIVSIIGSFCIAFFTQKWSYKNQRRLEEEKRSEEKSKTNNDTFKRLYSHISAALFEFLNNSVLSDFHKVHFEFYKDQSQLYKKFLHEIEEELRNYKSKITLTNSPDDTIIENYNVKIENLKDKTKEFKSKADASLEEVMKYNKIMIDSFNKINVLCYEYEYLIDNSKAVEQIKNVTDYINGFFDANPNLFYLEISSSYSNKKVESVLFRDKRDKILDKSIDLHEENIKPLIIDIQNKIKEETKIK